jgi:hypothetical protein
MKIKQAESICGTLSKPSKMPCFGYSIPAKYCKIGMKMRNIMGSICSMCYALKGRYIFKNVMAAMEKRYQSLKNPQWIDAIVCLISKKEKSGYFRWHDSGDLQAEKHLRDIIEIAKRLPHVKFWLPTREYNIVNHLLSEGEQLPDNLTVRLSALMFDGEVKPSQNPFDLPTSGASETGFNCPSSEQGNKCLDCRACWDKNVKVVTYRKH